MYEVFIGALITTIGSHFVHVNENTGNAQAVWKIYASYISTSTKADKEIQDLYITHHFSQTHGSYHRPTLKLVTDWLGMTSNPMNLWSQFNHVLQVA